MDQQEFIGRIAEYAVKDMEASGILASITIAQGILESGYGTKELAVNASNYFGMKTFLSGNNWPSVWDGVSKYTKQTKEQKKDGTEYTVTADFRKYPDMETSVRDHSCYLTGAKNGSALRYAGLKGERDYRKAVQIIKDGGYATDVNYVSKICNLIEKLQLYKYDDMSAPAEREVKMSIRIEERIVKDNPCYKANRQITPKGGMLHSVGCPQPDPEVFVRNWSKSTAINCVHAVVGFEKVVYQLLPWNWRGWHGGGSSNNTLISIEMTEPATIKYVGGANWIETGDGSNTKRHVLATYANAVEFFAYICKMYGFNPEDSNVLMSHHEGNLKGVASNHGDVEHLWKKFGLTMNQFRADVKKAMVGETQTTVPIVPVENKSDDTSGQAISPLSGTVKIIYDGSKSENDHKINDGINLRKAPSILAEVDHVDFDYNNIIYNVVGISKDEKWYKLDNGLFITTIPAYVEFKATPAQKESTAGTGYFRVRESWANSGSQIGAFKSKENAIELCKQNSGYRVFDNAGNEVYPLNESVPKADAFLFEVKISNLRIRKGPGTSYDYHKDNGKERYTGKGIFTIVKTEDGPGAKLWGLLKSYAGGQNGWIALDEVYGSKVD